MAPPKQPPTRPFPGPRKGTPGQGWDEPEVTDDVSNPGTSPSRGGESEDGDGEWDAPGGERSSADRIEPDGEDVYGEDEYPPEDDEVFDSEGSVSSTGARQGGGTHGHTQIGPVPPRAQAPDDESEATRAGPPVRLEVSTGPDAGEVRRFKGVRMVVSRVPGCDFQLSDQSVSRKHLELVQSGRGMLLRDLQSGNGTQVNGEKVTEVVLSHGDEIALGATVIRFVDEALALVEAQEEKARAEAEEKARVEALVEEKASEAEARGEPSMRPSAKGEASDEGDDDDEPSKVAGKTTPLRRKQLIGGAAAAIVAAGLLGLIIAFGGSHTPPPDPVEERAKKLLFRAKLAYDEERFAESVDLFAQVERLKPGLDADGLTALAQAELAAHQSLGRARELISQQRFDDARAELARTPQAGTKTQAQHGQLVSMLDALQAQALEGAVAAALARQDYAAATQAAQLLPPARQASVMADIDARRSQSESEKAAARAREQAEQAEREAREAEQRMEDAFGAVSRKFNEGSAGRAALECDRVLEKYGKYPEVRGRALELKRLIPLFERTWTDGLSRAQGGNSDSAYRALSRAAELYDQIALPGALGSDVHQAVNAAAYDVAKHAMAREDWASAAEAYRGVLERTPDDTEAREGLVRLEARAEDLWRFAYMVRDRDPRRSKQLFKAILEIVRPGSPVYEKTLAELKKMDPTFAVGGSR